MLLTNIGKIYEDLIKSLLLIFKLGNSIVSKWYQTLDDKSVKCLQLWSSLIKIIVSVKWEGFIE